MSHRVLALGLTVLLFVTETATAQYQFVKSIGSYGTGNGQFNIPLGVAADSSGNIWVADSGNNRIQKFDPTGTYLSQFGSMAPPTDNSTAHKVGP